IHNEIINKRSRRRHTSQIFLKILRKSKACPDRPSARPVGSGDPEEGLRLVAVGWYHILEITEAAFNAEAEAQGETEQEND
ncbi:MAG: hypothetical protein NUW37_17505, partial [Planctomycetes bacterium]|nr:hypothetical protein [Planctomycetota bacterium]